MRRLALLAIRFYQRHLSPRKGFCCAYRVRTGRASCSALGYRAIRRHGVFTGLGLVRERTRRCGEVHRQRGADAATSGVPTRRPPFAQRGDCDLPCGAECAVPGSDCQDMACQAADCLDCCSSCDWPSRRRSESRDGR